MRVGKWELFEPIRNICNLKTVVLKNTNHCSTLFQIVNNNSDREIFIGCHSTEVHCFGLLGRKVASHSDAIRNVRASILNITQDNDGNSTNAIEAEAKRTIVTRVTRNEEREFNFRVACSRFLRQPHLKNVATQRMVS